MTTAGTYLNTVPLNSFSAQTTLQVADRSYKIASLAALEKAGGPAAVEAPRLQKLPSIIRKKERSPFAEGIRNIVAW